MKNIPIIIPFKETSIRCPEKNFYLFPYTLEWLYEQDVYPQDIYVVSNSKRVEDLVTENNLNFVRESENGEYLGDIEASYTVAKKLNVPYYIFLPLTQPIRNKNLIDQIRSLKDENFDFVTTYQNISDRSIYYIDNNDKFIHPSKNRKGCLCPSFKMLDGSIYGIKTAFIESIINSEDINASFWNGKFKTIYNDVNLFLDVDTKKDLSVFMGINF